MQRFKQIGVAIFTLIFAILTPLSVFAESGTVTSARQIFLGGGSSTWSFTVDDGQGNMDGACVDPTNMSIPLGGQTANLERLDNSSHLAKLAYLAKDEFTTDVQQYAVGRAGARILGLTEYNHYNYSNVVNSIYDRAKSVTVPVGFEAWLVRPTNGSQMILSWRYSPVGYVKLFKQVDDSSGIISKYPSAYSRAGAVYGVYSSSSLSGSSRVGTLTTTASGNSNVLSLNAGTYYVKEITPSKGFKLDPNTYTATVVSGQTKTISSIEPPEFGKAYVKKTVAKNKHLTDLCPEQYSLAGAEFLLTNIENPNVSAKLITDNNGVSEIQQLVAGTYSVKETKAPKGYKINRNIPNITVTDGKTTEINVADEPLFDPLSLKVQKKAEEGADKNISLEGAEYTVKYYKEYLSKEQVEAGVKPFRTWTFRTDKNGIFQYRDKWKIGGGELFKLASGIPAGLMGTYAVYETKAPKGFAKTDGIISLQHVKVDNTFENVTVMKDATDIEKTQKVNIQIQKVDAETGNPLPQGYGSFKGAEFSVWYFDAREGKDIKAGDVVTDENGFASLDAQTPGLYTLREEKAPAGYVTNKKEVKVEARIKEINTAFFDYKSEVPEKPITVEITKSSINEKGEKVSVKGAVLALFTKDGRKLEEWTTDGKAHILKALPKGEYVIKELKTPKGYLPLEEDFRFTVKETEDVQKKDVFNEPIPELKTKALFDTEIPNSLNKDKVKLIDTVRYDKVLKDHLYTLKGEVLNRETGKVVAKGETKFIPKNANGEAKVEYTFNAKDLKGATLVVTERLFRDDRKTEDKKVAEHIDLMDSQQTVYIPKLETLAYDKKDGGKDFLGRDKQVLVDEVRYSNLKPEREYTVKGVLMDSKTGKSLGIKAEKTFTAGAENGLVKIEYTFLADKLDGISPVVFEELYDGKTLIAEHKDQFDLKQTVHSPKIRTKATDKVDGGKDVFAKGEQTVVDTVKYSNLIVGKTYTVKGILMDQETGKPIVDGGKEVKAEKTFTAEKKDGTIDLEFIIKDSKALEGKTTIVFENLYRDKKLVGVHEEIKDKDQSVYFPKVRTKANINGKEKAVENKDMKITDVVSYSNLIVGKKYTVKGVLMDKSAGKPLLINGSEVRAEKTFTAEKKDGTTTLEFIFDGTGYGNKEVVVFEKMYRGDKLIGQHEDINDKDQTVKIVKIGTIEITDKDKFKRWGSVFTGDNNNLYLYALALLVSGSFIVIVRRKKNK